MLRTRIDAYMWWKLQQQWRTESLRDESSVFPAGQHRSESILAAVAHVAGVLLGEQALETSVGPALAHLGSAAEVDRIFVMENHPGQDGSLLTSIRYEWAAPGLDPPQYGARVQGRRWDDSRVAACRDNLMAGQVIVGNASQMPLDFAEILEMHSIRSLVLVPIFVASEWWGVIGLFECGKEREWSRAELDALRAAASTLGAGIRSKRADAALRKTQDELEGRVRERTAQLEASNERLRREIDRHQRTQQELQLIQAAVEETREGVLIVGPDLRPEHSEILYFNPAYAQLAGVTPEEIYGKSLLDHPFSHLITDVFRDFSDQLMRGEACSSRTVFVDTDGRQRVMEWRVDPILDAEGKIASWVSIQRDITDQLRTEEALFDSEHRFSAVLDTVPIMIWLTDATGACIKLNQRWLEFTGRTESQEEGFGWLEGIHAEDRERCLTHLRAAVEAKVPFTTEFRLRSAGGAYHTILLAASPHNRHAGRFEGFIGAAIDVTIQKRIDFMLRQTEMLKTSGRIAGRYTHEVNNRLGSLSNAIELIEGGIPTDYKFYHYIDEIKALIRELADLVRACDILYRPVREGVYEILVQGVLDEVVALLDYRSHDREVRVHIEGPPKGTTLRQFENMFRLVIHAIVQDAVEASPQGGVVKVVARMEKPHLRIDIEDERVGDPPDLTSGSRDRWSEPYLASNPGLGLMIARRLVEAMEGKITCGTRPGGGGALLRLWLPGIPGTDRSEVAP